MTPKTIGWDELHLAENPAVELLDFLGYTYVPPEGLEGERQNFKETILHRTPRVGPQAAESLALRDERRQGGEGGHADPGRQSRGGQREGLYVAHLRHRTGAGPGRRTEEPHGQVLRLRSA